MLRAMHESGVHMSVISPVRDEERKWSSHSEAVEALMQKKLGGFGSAVGSRPRLGVYVSLCVLRIEWWQWSVRVKRQVGESSVSESSSRSTVRPRVRRIDRMVCRM